MENHTGKVSIIHFSAIKNVSISPAIREQIRKILTVCSAIVRFMRLEINVEAIFVIRIKELRIVQIVSFLIREKLWIYNRKIRRAGGNDEKIKDSE